jgi:hypothetical protein
MGKRGARGPHVRTHDARLQIKKKKFFLLLISFKISLINIFYF